MLRDTEQVPHAVAGAGERDERSGVLARLGDARSTLRHARRVLLEDLTTAHRRSAASVRDEGGRRRRVVGASARVAA
eukprot:6206520-Pleurochrysis_carterae.AAC.3